MNLRLEAQDYGAHHADIVNAETGEAITSGYGDAWFDPAVAQEIARRVNAFDALLAIVTATAQAVNHGGQLHGGIYLNDIILLRMALEGLDAAHPGWREWSA